MPRLPHGREVHSESTSIAVLQYPSRPVQDSRNDQKWVVRHRPMLALERRWLWPRCDLARQRGAFSIDGGIELTSGTSANQELHLDVRANHVQRFL